MKNLILGVVLLSVGCGSSGSGNAEPASCDPQARSGTYLVHYVERSGGTCGPVTDQVAILGGSAASSCKALTPQTTSDNGCAISTDAECTADDGTITKVSGITHQNDETATHLSGTESFTIETPGGVPQCTSTYDVTYTRQ